jgi:hypothetical protein
VLSPTGCYSRSPGLRVRALPELDTCLAYLPRPPRLCRLNLGAWLILELCDGRSADALCGAYVEALDGATQRSALLEQLSAGIEELMQLGLVHDTRLTEHHEETKA